MTAAVGWSPSRSAKRSTVLQSQYPIENYSNPRWACAPKVKNAGPSCECVRRSLLQLTVSHVPYVKCAALPSLQSRVEYYVCIFVCMSSCGTASPQILDTAFALRRLLHFRTQKTQEHASPGEVVRYSGAKNVRRLREEQLVHPRWSVIRRRSANGRVRYRRFHCNNEKH